MISRRTLLISLAGAPLAACNSAQKATPEMVAFGEQAGFGPDYWAEERRRIPLDDEETRPAKLARKVVPYDGGEAPGTILVRTKDRWLYLVSDTQEAIRYPVGVGKAGKQWQGRAEIDGAFVEPAWAPTPEIKQDNPNVPDLIPGGTPENPMGARVLTLSGGKYAIHGTNRPESIGTNASYGCIRMFNADVIDLFGRVRVGTEVVVT